MKRILILMAIAGGCSPEYDIRDNKGFPSPTPDTQTTVDSPKDPPFLVGEPNIQEKNPLILIDPYDYVFEDVLVNCSDEYDVRIANVGDATLDIYEWEYIYTPDLTMTSLLEPPFSLEPGEDTYITFKLDENDTIKDVGKLYISSNALGKSEQMVKHDGQGQAWGSQVDVFEQEEINKADILFVIDNSCSMIDEQAGLADNAESFIDDLIDAGVDFEISVITTDSPAPTSSKITPDSADPVAEFSRAVFVGNSGSATEMGQEMAKQALDLMRGTITPREDAALSVVVVSDENDFSPLTELEYYDFFLSIKEEELFFFHSVVSLGFGCGLDMGDRYILQSNLTGGMYMDICSSWGDNLNTIANSNYIIGTIYPLTSEALPGTIQIFLNGVEFTGPWRYDYGSNSVILEDTSSIIGHELLQISYDFVEQC